MRIIEIAKTIFGEGPRQGIPCVLVRVAGCSLSCSYCDHPESRDESKGSDKDPFELVREISKLNLQNVLITGGEPLDTSSVVDLCVRLKAQGFAVTIETGGSRPIGELLGCSVIMDYKLPSSGMTERMYLGNMINPIPHTAVKFVVSGREDFDEAIRVISRYQPARFFFTSATGTEADIAKWLIDRGINAPVQVRMHKILGLP